MEEGRRKIRLCLLCVVMAAVAIGVFYYYYGSREGVGSEGTLIRGPKVESHVC